MQLLFLQEWFSDEILKATGWTLIHSLWQGLLAAVLAGIIIISTRRTEARLRYNLLGAVLVLFTVTTTITFLRELKTGNAANKSFDQAAITNTDISFTDVNYETASAPALTTIDKFVTYFNANADLFVLIWAIFFFVHCIKLVTGLAGVQRIRNYRTHQPPEEWLKKMDQLCKLLHIKQTAGLVQSELVKVPVAIGFFKPVILVPLGLLSNLPAEQVETILLHELAHIRRKDYLVNIMQRVTEAIFFFNPALLWISSLVRQEREACCDDIVVANTKHKGTYLEALVSFQEYSLTSTTYAMAISSKKHYLLNRVKRMVTRENKKLDIMEKVFLGIGLIAFTAFTFIPKKDVAIKKDIPIISGSKETPAVASTPVKRAVLPGPAQSHKAVVKKEIKKAVVEIQEHVLPADTVPSKKEKTDYSGLKFPSISSTVNDDGNTKTETTTVTDGDGKKYTYTKLNNKITSLIVDGKNIPENERTNYSVLLDQIERAIQENKARRSENMQLRKLATAQRNEDMKNRIAEKRLQREYQSAQKQYLLQQNRLEKSGRTLDGQRKEVMKLLQRLKERRMNVPMLNGREIIKNDIHVDNSTLVKVDLNKKPAQVLQKIVDLKKVNNSTVEKNLVVKSELAIALNAELNTEVSNNLLRDDDYKPAIGHLNLIHKTANEKSTVPVKAVAPVRSGNIQPLKNKPGTIRSLSRRVVS